MYALTVCVNDRYNLPLSIDSIQNTLGWIMKTKLNPAFKTSPGNPAWKHSDF